MTPINSSKLYKIISAFFPLISWAGIIFFLSSQESLPGFDLSAVDFIFKKTAHVFVYAVLYYLTYRALEITTSKGNNFIWLQALIICLIYAVSDELHQSTVAGRYATIRDVGYDMLGATLVFLRKMRYI